MIIHKQEIELLNSYLKDNQTLVLEVRDTIPELSPFVKGSILVKDNEVSINWIKQLSQEYDALYLIISQFNKDNKDSILSMFKLLDNLKGYFECSDFTNHTLDYNISIEADEFLLDYKQTTPLIVDLRSESDFISGHIKNADSLHYLDMPIFLENMPSEEMYYLYDNENEIVFSIVCLLKKHNLYNYYILNGGYKALIQSGLETETVNP